MQIVEIVAGCTYVNSSPCVPGGYTERAIRKATGIRRTSYDRHVRKTKKGRAKKNGRPVGFSTRDLETGRKTLARLRKKMFPAGPTWAQVFAQLPPAIRAKGAPRVFAAKMGHRFKIKSRRRRVRLMLDETYAGKRLDFATQNEGTDWEEDVDCFIDIHSESLVTCLRKQELALSMAASVMVLRAPSESLLPECIMQNRSLPHSLGPR
jgi:hypothetical protein